MISSLGADSIPRRALHDELTDRVRALITDGHLHPAQKIPERELCERFGVSRTPLREALKVLASEGVVRLLPNRGAVVNTLTIENLEELFLVGGALEGLSGEIACQKITDREIAEIRKLHEALVVQYKRGNQQRYSKLNQQIHEAILESTRNETLKSAYRALPGYVLTARFVANMSDERWSHAVAEHEAILEALASRNGPALSKLLRQHLANKLANVKEWLASQHSSTATPIPVASPKRSQRTPEAPARAVRSTRRRATTRVPSL
ncbi:MAG TPA: GntR family transcriptional regulator [Devosia sp.]|nr:GntR family transcriptional regulator [Devosia sp.]